MSERTLYTGESNLKSGTSYGGRAPTRRFLALAIQMDTMFTTLMMP